MPSPKILAPNQALNDATRLRPVVAQQAPATATDWLTLATCGAAAACATNFFDFNLRIPGHAILRVVLPMTFGLALVPRYGAGCVMAASAAVTAGMFRAAGFAGDGLSLGAMTSLIATGPLLDFTLRHTRGGWQLYAAFAAAGLASNTLALVVRATAKTIGLEHAAGRQLTAWLPQAIITYPACGLAAGLLSAALLFYARRKTTRHHEPEQ